MNERPSPHTFSADHVPRLEAWLTEELGVNSIKFAPPEILGGGAIGENWRLDVELAGGGEEKGALTGRQIWVLRTDAPATLFISHNRGNEFELSKLAFENGVRVPRPIINCLDKNIIGAPFMIAKYAPGTANGRKIVRAPDRAGYGPALARELGRQLAKIHAIDHTHTELPFLAHPTNNPAIDQVALLRRVLDQLSEPAPALEFILAWLAEKAPECPKIVLNHGDYRTGNYLVDDGKLTAILDWEFAHWGDPHLDIGWFTARCWRFGNPGMEAGGIAPRADFYAGYNEVARTPLNEAVIPYWEVMAAARWASVARLQAERHFTGGEESIELLLTGTLAPEITLEALRGIEAIEKRGGMAS